MQYVSKKHPVKPEDSLSIVVINVLLLFLDKAGKKLSLSNYCQGLHSMVLLLKVTSASRMHALVELWIIKAIQALVH